MPGSVRRSGSSLACETTCRRLGYLAQQKRTIRAVSGTYRRERATRPGRFYDLVIQGLEAYIRSQAYFPDLPELEVMTVIWGKKERLKGHFRAKVPVRKGKTAIQQQESRGRLTPPYCRLSHVPSGGSHTTSKSPLHGWILEVPSRPLCCPCPVGVIRSQTRGDEGERAFPDGNTQRKLLRGSGRDTRRYKRIAGCGVLVARRLQSFQNTICSFHYPYM